MTTKHSNLIKQHRPVGWSIKNRRTTANDGMATLTMEITINKELKGTERLFVVLHECGHVHMRHLKGDGKMAGPRWREEYEADQYAIGAMKKAGIPIPRERLKHHKEVVRTHIEQADGSETVPDAILKYAYGRSWKAQQ